MGKFYKIYSEKLTFGLALTTNKSPMPLTYAEAGFQHNAMFGSRILHVLPMLEAGLTEVKHKQMHCLLVTFLRKRAIGKFSL